MIQPQPTQVNTSKLQREGKAKRLVLRLVLPGLLLLPLIWLLPVPANLPQHIAPRYSVGIVAVSFFAWMHVCAAILFFMGLGSFKQKIGRAYKAVCLGSLLMGLALFQPPILLALNMLESRFFINGYPFILQVLTVSMLFWAVGSFAYEFGDKKIWKKAAYILPAVLIVTIVGGFLASDPFNLTSVFRLWGALLGCVNALIILHVKRMASQVFTGAMAWFFLALMLGAIAQAVGLIVWIQGDPTNLVIVIPYSLTAILYVKAAYTFNKIGEY